MTSDAFPNDADEAIALLGDEARHREGLLALAAQAIAAGDPMRALRFIDRARRLSPGDTTITLLYARLLGQTGRPDEGVRALDRVSARGRWAAHGLLEAELLLQAGDIDRAGDILSDLAGLFALEALPRFGEIADAVCAAAPERWSGWLAFAANGALIGALTGEEGDPVAVLRPPPADLARVLESLPDRAAVIGAGRLRWPPAWRLDGWFARYGGQVRGEATLDWAPGRGLIIVLTDEAGNELAVDTTPDVDPSGRPIQVFSASLPEAWADSTIAAHALLQDGRRARLEDRAPRARPDPSEATWPAAPTPQAAIVVPVYAGLEETLTCLRSVLNTVEPERAELIVVYDQGPEPALLAAIQAMADEGRLTLLVNEANLGFPAAANRGMALRPDRDVVLLNADTEVFGDWLFRLTSAAYAQPDVGTATPFTNSGSIMSYPRGAGAGCDSARAAELDVLFGEASAAGVVDIPTAVGFCMYVKRACLDAVGPFEETAFGLGYGEENDFCLRARALGWRNVAAPNLFVRHVGGRSFGPLREVLGDTNLRVLERRHPGYLWLIDDFLARDPLHDIRRRIDERLAAMAPRPSVLILTLGRDGGVQRHVEDRKAALQAEGLGTVELRPTEEEFANGACRLVVDGANYDDLVYRLPDEFEDLTRTLSTLAIERIEIHHTLGLDPAVLDLPRRLDKPYDIVVHDYVWICPRITLMRGDEGYCGEPDVSVCVQCVAEHGALIEEDISAPALRERSRELFEAAASVTVPGSDVAVRLRRYFPNVPFVVDPWEPPVVPVAPRPPPTGRARAALIGAIGNHKGYARLLDCARDAQARDLPLDFVVIGYTVDDPPLFETGRVFVTGRFEEDEVLDLIRREGCNVAFFPGVVPETWSYTLSHALRSGLPIVAHDFAALGERLANVGRARLMPVDADPAELNDALIEATRPKARIWLRTRGQGPVDFASGVWARPPEDAGWIDGMKIELTDLQCRAVFAGGEETPWTRAPTWCAPSGPPRPLLGFALNLGGDLGRVYRCDYGGVFSSGLTVDGVGSGEVCRSPMPNDPLVALRFSVGAAA